MKPNPGRLMILGLLARGPMHGHQIRRRAEVSNVEQWGEVRVGAIYGMLHRLEEEGLIEAVRSEQVGRRPVRTVYAITDEGRMELHAHREAALTSIGLASAPIDVALIFAPGDVEELMELMERRRAAIAALLEEVRAHRMSDEAAGFLPEPIGSGVFLHGEHRLEAELRWHDEMKKRLEEKR